MPAAKAGIFARALDVDTRRRVLVVDDNRELTEIIRRHLMGQDLEVLTAVTADAAVAAFRQGPCDALVVDLLLPDRTGHRLLAELAELRALPPVFVISGVFRGPSAEAQIAAITPFAGWFEKPFDVRLLVQAICQLLGHVYRPLGGRSAAEAQALRTYEAEHPSTGGHRDRGPRDRGAELAVDLASELLAEEQTQAPEAFASSLSRASFVRQTDPFRDCHSGFGRSTTPSATDMSVGLRTQMRAGDLRTTPVARLFGAFFLASETAEVAFECGSRKQIVYFEDGRPVYALSNQPQDRLGAVVSRELGIDPAEVRVAAAQAKAERRSMGAEMIRRGWLDAGRLDEIMRSQARRLLLELFRWPFGEYVIRFRRRRDRPRVELPGNVATLVLDGVRNALDLERLQDLLPDAARLLPSPNPPFPLYELPIADVEAALLLRVTGARTVRDLIDQAPTGLDERAVRAILYGLLTLGVLVSGRPSPGGEFSVDGSVVSAA